jgi:hypothetical protein
LRAQTKASELPVLPPVYSTTVCPGVRRPDRSAPSIIASAIRSLYEPVGLQDSSLTQISAASGVARRFRRTIGVFPIDSSIAARTPIAVDMRRPYYTPMLPD